ncbi:MULTISPECIES: hypothetical protein [Streptomyces]|uniref:hypothetical protein n=1 Tax=Streptomyces TaxID=1883 RepID=UPI000F6ED0FC|nr:MULTISPECIES: hypothetical protein [unclassified Streptomyces]AZM87467.1 hypothetical protein D1J60_02255 [Streptomyces sp. W1SF4]RSS62211.1 hypothetical protein EF912_05365 [Streptomyces sp. WAC07061]
MTWASWTTRGVFAGRGGVRTAESVLLTGELDVHTTWTEDDRLARVAVQHSGATEWLTLAGSPAPCPSEEASRALHDAVLLAVRTGGEATLPHPGITAPAG